jgi:lysozyme
MLVTPVHAIAQEQEVPELSSSPFAVIAPLPELAMAARLPQVMSELGIVFLKSVEGFRSMAYHDMGGGYSIGYGFRTWRGRRVTLAYPYRVTEAEANAELERQLFTYEEIVRREFNGLIPQHSFDALVSLCYNLGRLNTAILRKVRAGRPVGIQDFLTTAVVRSQFSRSLYSRRVREFAMFIGRYEDALSADLRAWHAARVAHQALLRHSVRVVSARGAGYRNGSGDVPASWESIVGAPLSDEPANMAAARAVAIPLSAGR